MEVNLKREAIQYCTPVYSDTLSREETLETVVSDTLPDIARIRADAVGRDRAQDQEIATLKARLAVLESGSGTPAGTRVESPPAAPAVFPARTDEVIACPRCGRRQKGNRHSCYACGLPFRYEQE